MSKSNQTLILMVGLPRSGKSTLARTLAADIGAPIVCPDEIRLALHGQRFSIEAEPWVWLIAETMVKALFGSGHRQVIIDACNETPSRREQWYSKYSDVRHVVVPTDPETCVLRAEATGQADLIPIIRSKAVKSDMWDWGNLTPLKEADEERR